MRPQKYTLEQRKEMVRGRLLFHGVCSYFSGLIARSWSTEAQGNIPAFFIPMTPKEKGTWSIFVDKGRVLGRPIPILPYRSSLSYSMTNPWISKQRSTIFLISTPSSCCPGFGVHLKPHLLTNGRFCYSPFG